MNLGRVVPLINGKLPVNGEVVLTPTDVGAVNKGGDQMTGILKAQSNSDYSVAQVRNIILSPNQPTNDVGNDGDIWLQFE